ncbi:TPA: hypothetical protein SLG40_000752 [Serratia odorifera]|nr:hypothetical protein [Serratia odorifera]
MFLAPLLVKRIGITPGLLLASSALALHMFCFDPIRMMYSAAQSIGGHAISHDPLHRQSMPIARLSNWTPGTLSTRPGLYRRR